MSKRTALFGAALLLTTAVAAEIAYHRMLNTFGDWNIFMVGARVLVHFHQETTNLYADPRLHLYADNPDIQIGPPALWLVAAFASLPLRTVFALFSIVMPILGVIGIGAATVAGGRLAERGWDSRKSQGLMLGAGITTAALFATEVDHWKHLDDVMALSFAAVAAFLIARGKPWWLIGVLLGTGIAAKPWALILVPMLLALPRRDLAKTLLATVLVATAWWAPFVIGAPDTLNALGQYQIVPDPGSVLHLVGITGHVEGWLRPVQFLLGLGVGAYVCLHRPWLGAPLAALATRVLTDPFAYGYYGMGPILFAYLYDCAGRGWRGLPVFTAFTAVMEFAIPFATDNATVIATAKLAWAVVVLGAVLLSNRSHADESAGIRERPQASPA